jgi:hypothetical protein
MFPIVYSCSKDVPTLPFYLLCLFTVSGLSEGLASGLSEAGRNDTPTMITKSFSGFEVCAKIWSYISDASTNQCCVVL